MTNQPDLPSLIAAAAAQRKLRPRDDLAEPDWHFWELRNLNMHRVAGLLQADRQFAEVSELEAEIRGAIARNFKRAWWRGLAYGIVVEGAPTSWTPDDLKSMVDIYENSKGVLQWVILTAREEPSAIGVHTWMESYLSPVYRAVLDGLRASGYRLTTAIKGKDGLLKFLTGVSAARGVAFPDFRDEQPGN